MLVCCYATEIVCSKVGRKGGGGRGESEGSENSLGDWVKFSLRNLCVRSSDYIGLLHVENYFHVVLFMGCFDGSIIHVGYGHGKVMESSSHYVNTSWNSTV